MDDGSSALAELLVVSVCLRTERADGSVMRPRSFSRRRNINALVIQLQLQLQIAHKSATI